MAGNWGQTPFLFFSLPNMGQYVESAPISSVLFPLCYILFC